MRTINRLRWRIARWIAPDPIIARPIGGGSAVLIADPEMPEMYAWVAPKTLEITVENEIVRPGGDEFGLANLTPGRSGIIRGTI